MYARSAQGGGAHQSPENAFLVHQMGMDGWNCIKKGITEDPQRGIDGKEAEYEAEGSE